MTSPNCILNRSSCFASTLSESDQHATLMLVDTTNDTTEKVKSLLKLTVDPCHRSILTSTGEEADDSNRIVQFLKGYDFKLSSESGAEYSYYRAKPKSSVFKALKNFVWGEDYACSVAFKAELISPASERQIQRAMPSSAFSLVHESPDLYNKVTFPHIQSIVKSGSLAWIQNVIDGAKEKERLLLDNEDYILNIDTKWRSHPDPKIVPREEWYGHKSVEDLYCLAIFKIPGVSSLRDLRATHLSALRSIVSDCPFAIEKVYGVPHDQLRIFVHYLPQFYHFHVHVTRLENDIGCQVERSHLVLDIIQNLEMDSEFYAKRTITYKLRITDDLYKAMKELKD